MLTPPPEATWTASQLLFASTLAPEEKKLIAAFTPPRSDHSPGVRPYRAEVAPQLR